MDDKPKQILDTSKNQSGCSIRHKIPTFTQHTHALKGCGVKECGLPGRSVCIDSARDDWIVGDIISLICCSPSVILNIWKCWLAFYEDASYFCFVTANMLLFFIPIFPSPLGHWRLWLWSFTEQKSFTQCQYNGGIWSHNRKKAKKNKTEENHNIRQSNLSQNRCWHVNINIVLAKFFTVAS